MLTAAHPVTPGLGLSLRAVRRVFQDGGAGVEAVRDGSGSAAAGEFVAVRGPSGGGKSTRLRMIAGLDRPDGGELVVHREGAVGHAGRIAYVFQDAHLLPWRDVLKNVALPLELMN